jgi:hypothetical protein
MSKLSNEGKEHLKRMNDTFLYNLGYHNTKNANDDVDVLLEEYKDIEVPESLNNWFFGYNKKIVRKNRQKQLVSNLLKYSKRVAAILIIFIVMSSVVIMSVDSFRIRFFNMVVETSQKFTLVSQEENTANGLRHELLSDWSDFYFPTYLPKDYALADVRILNNTKYMTFKNLDDLEIRFIQGGLESQSQIDSENGEIIELLINGNEGILVIKEDRSILYWSNQEKAFYIQGSIDKTTIIKIAESIEKK